MKEGMFERVIFVNFQASISQLHYRLTSQRRIQSERRERKTVLFCNHFLFFCNNFEELQPVSIRVKLIGNNAPLTYIYSNTIKPYLTPNHLLFARQLLCYSNTTSTVVRSLTVLSSTTDKISHISNHFCHRWRHEYVVNLCEAQRASKLNTNFQKIMLCQFMIKKCLDTFGELPQ